MIRGGTVLVIAQSAKDGARMIMDAGAIEEIDADEIAYPDDEADERNIIELLRRTLECS